MGLFGDLLGISPEAEARRRYKESILRRSPVTWDRDTLIAVRWRHPGDVVHGEPVPPKRHAVPYLVWALHATGPDPIFPFLKFDWGESPSAFERRFLKTLSPGAAEAWDREIRLRRREARKRLQQWAHGQSYHAMLCGRGAVTKLGLKPKRADVGHWYAEVWPATEQGQKDLNQLCLQMTGSIVDLALRLGRTERQRNPRWDGSWTSLFERELDARNTERDNWIREGCPGDRGVAGELWEIRVYPTQLQAQFGLDQMAAGRGEQPGWDNGDWAEAVSPDEFF